MIACGLDFGTSNSAIGVARDGAIALAPLEGSSTLMPSAVFFDYETKGRVLFGSAAVSAYVGQTEGRLMRALKSILGSSLIDDMTSLGDRKVPLADVVETFVRHLKDKAEAFAGQEITSVVHGRPVRFVDGDERADARAQDMLEAIARRAGFRDIAFVYEPIAAAHHYERTVQTEELVLIADIGGGTSDFSVVRIGPHRRERAERGGDVLANAGVRLGGTDFDSALNLVTVMPLLGLGTHLVEKDLPMPNALYHELATWATINFAYTRRNERDVAQMVSDAREPEKVGRLLKVIRQRLGHRLAFAVEEAKIALSGAGPCGPVSCLCRRWPCGDGRPCRLRARDRSPDRPAVRDGKRLHHGGRPRRRRGRHDLSHGRLESRPGRARSDRACGALRPHWRPVRTSCRSRWA